MDKDLLELATIIVTTNVTNPVIKAAHRANELHVSIVNTNTSNGPLIKACPKKLKVVTTLLKLVHLYFLLSDHYNKGRKINELAEVIIVYFLLYLYEFI